MMPGNAIRRHPVVEDRMRRLAQYAETCDLNRVEMGDTKLGIITSSTSYQYVKEVFAGGKRLSSSWGWSTLCPEGLIRDFAAKVDRLVVVEELDPIIENYCRQLRPQPLSRQGGSCPWRGSSPRTWWPPSWAARYIPAPPWRTPSRPARR